MAQTSKDGSQKTRQSTISDKPKTKGANPHLVPPSREQAKPKFVDGLGEGKFANLNVLTASQSVDFITKKPPLQDEKLTKSSNDIGGL